MVTRSYPRWSWSFPSRRIVICLMPRRPAPLATGWTLWWRIGPPYTHGPGWHIVFFPRATDYQLFSERMGIHPVRRVGPLRIKRLEKLSW